MFEERTAAGTTADVVTQDDDAIYCATCGHLVTRGRWRIHMNGEHQHTVFNPAGILFRLLCFKEAPGVTAIGDPTSDFTWFRGYDWQVGLCAGCEAHLGWQFAGDQEPPVFFGLIKPRLSSDKR